MGERYELVPCMGVGAPREHLVDVRDTSGDAVASVGFTTIEDAIERFGIENVWLSGSHGTCPDCYARMTTWTSADFERVVPAHPFTNDLFRLNLLMLIIEGKQTRPEMVHAFPHATSDWIQIRLSSLKADGFIRPVRSRTRGVPAYAVTPEGLAARDAFAASRSSPGRRVYEAAKAAAAEALKRG